MHVSGKVDEVGEVELNLGANGGSRGLVHALKVQIVHPDFTLLLFSRARVDVHHQAHPVDMADVGIAFDRNGERRIPAAFLPEVVADRAARISAVKGIVF